MEDDNGAVSSAGYANCMLARNYDTETTYKNIQTSPQASRLEADGLEYIRRETFQVKL